MDYSSNFDPTSLNPNGCTMDDFKQEQEDYCDVKCDDRPCTCERICVQRLAGIGSRGVRDGRKDGFGEKYYHSHAALEYTTDSGWCDRNRFDYIDASDETNIHVEGVSTDEAKWYPKVLVNDTIIKRCVSCFDILATVRQCVDSGKKSDQCDAHSQSVISRCAEKMCSSSMQISEDLMLENLDVPALLFMYFVIGLILVIELRELFISDVAFRRCVKNATVMGYMDESKKWLGFSLRLLQQLRRFVLLPGVVILMCINNFSAESMLDVIATAIEMAFILDIDNLFFNSFFSTSGEQDLMSDLLKVRLSKRQEVKLSGAQNLSILCSVVQMTYFSLLVFRGKRCTDEDTLAALSETVVLAQCLALLPVCFCSIDMNILKIQRYKNMMVGHGLKKNCRAAIKVWTSTLAYGLDKFLVLCIPAAFWISTFSAKFYNMEQYGSEAPITYIFLRILTTFLVNFVPWHFVLTTLFTLFVNVTNFGEEFLFSVTIGDDVYEDWYGVIMVFLDFVWEITPTVLSTYGAGILSAILGPFPTFGFSMESTSDYRMDTSNSSYADPTAYPSAFPTGAPSRMPSMYPSSAPTGMPSMFPTGLPSSLFPSSMPSMMPSGAPSLVPTGMPT